MPLWGPDTWDHIGTVGLALFVVAFHITAYLRGWLVPGHYHNEIVGALRAEIEQGKVRAASDADVMLVQMRTIAEKNASEAVAEHLLRSVREIAERKSG